jgi:hypothetical protein
MPCIKDQLAMFLKLRNDALSRGLQELAIVYGWTAMRLGQELCDEQMRLLIAERAKREARQI